jgi:uncharacterized protein
MATRDSNWPEGTPCWVDLGVPDIERAATFYAAVFSWTIPEGSPETGGYRVATLKGLNVAGIGPKMGPPDAPTMWLTYLATDNADAAADRIKGAGGQIVMDPMDVMEHGRMVVAIDPAGASFGLWQGRRHTGAGLVNEQGALTWNEHFSRDFEASKAFYHAVFGYEYTDMSGEGFTYATFKVGGKDVGGMGEYPADAPASAQPGWSVYFGATDTDASVARVIGEGGSTLREAENSPYGRLATVTDDQGAVFSIISVAGS